MNENNVLPADFDGVFRFTNFTDHDFTAKWDGVEYTFPALKTTPMVISGASPEQVQSIRKKFAKELAIMCFYESDKFKKMNEHTPGGVPGLYTDSDLAPFIQRCLEPLPLAQAVVRMAPKLDVDKQLKKDPKTGKNVTRVLEQGESLTQSGSESLE